MIQRKRKKRRGDWVVWVPSEQGLQSKGLDKLQCDNFKEPSLIKKVRELRSTSIQSHKVVPS